MTQQEIAAHSAALVEAMAKCEQTGDDAAWLKAWSDYFAVSRRLSTRRLIAKTLEDAERRVETLKTPADRALEVVWARVFSAYYDKDFAAVRDALPKFEAALQRAGVTQGEAIGDLELFKSVVASFDRDENGAVEACQRACAAYRVAGAMSSRQFLYAADYFARRTGTRDPKLALAHWHEAAKAVHRFYAEDESSET
jgi:hypothetical protein